VRLRLLAVLESVVVVQGGWRRSRTGPGCWDAENERKKERKKKEEKKKRKKKEKNPQGAHAHARGSIGQDAASRDSGRLRLDSLRLLGRAGLGVTAAPPRKTFWI